MPVTRGQGNPNWTRDETILALDLLLRGWPIIPGADAESVQELSEVIRRLPIHPDASRNDRFRNPDGVYMKLQNLASLHPDRADRKGLRSSTTDREVWAAFAGRRQVLHQVAEEIRRGIPEVVTRRTEALGGEDWFEAVEGQVLSRVHLIRERERGFRIKVLARVRRETGALQCEACGRAISLDGHPSLEAIFEVHHLIPLAKVATSVTRLSDLVLLCANCHRLIHAVMRCTREHCGLDEFRTWLATHAADHA